MEIAVRSGSPSDHPSDYEVEEKNRSFGPTPQDCGRCILDGKACVILVTVPPRLPGVTCQTDTTAYLSLIECFRAPVLTASAAGASSVTFPALGTRWHHWSHVQSASAARRALEELYEAVPDGFRVTFAVEDVDAIAALVRAHGGTITMEKAVIPTVGALIRFNDTEGNDCGAMRYETPPHT